MHSKTQFLARLMNDGSLQGIHTIHVDSAEIHLYPATFGLLFGGEKVIQNSFSPEYDMKLKMVDGVKFFCLVQAPSRVERPVEIVEGAE